MNVKRFVLAIAFASLVTTVFDVVLNAIILRSTFEEAAPYWRSADELNRLVPVGWLAMLLVMISLGLLFVRTLWRGVRRGLEFGSCLALAACFAVAGMATLVPWPVPVLSGMALQQVANSIVLGFSVGWLYSDESHETEGPGGAI